LFVRAKEFPTQSEETAHKNAAYRYRREQHIHVELFPFGEKHTRTVMDIFRIDSSFRWDRLWRRVQVIVIIEIQLVKEGDGRDAEEEKN